VAIISAAFVMMATSPSVWNASNLVLNVGMALICGLHKSKVL
jgi:hypothetical protein